MLKKLISLSHLTFVSLSHKKIYYVGLTIGTLLTLLSLLLGPLGFNDEIRLAINFGLSGAQVGAIFLAVLAGASLLKEELESQAAFIFLSKDISRSTYLLAQFFGFAVSLSVTLLILSGFFFLTSFLTGLEWGFKVFIPFAGIFVESLVLFSFALFISLLTSTLLTVGLSFCFFLITHWVSSLEFLLKLSPSEYVKTVGPILLWILPNMEGLNWKSDLTYNEWDAASAYGASLLYGLSWVVIFLVLAIVVFEEKDLT
ncbi:MAG: ABC transporter permease [Bdellovibrionaceae bacterium]|nr:ABC transporter permease [Pseudobdellovibrionaceae bacterium]